MFFLLRFLPMLVIVLSLSRCNGGISQTEILEQANEELVETTQDCGEELRRAHALIQNCDCYCDDNFRDIVDD